MTNWQMDKASIIKDAIEYIQLLQQQERQMLAEISLLESAPKTHDRLLLTTPSCAAAAVVPESCAGHVVSPTKKVRRALSFSSAAPPCCCAASPPVEALEVHTLVRTLMDNYIITATSDRPAGRGPDLER